MHRHGPSCLTGPLSRNHTWWMEATSPRSAARSAGRRKSNMNGNKNLPARDPEIRAELVERVRREIAAGIYETPEKWAVALERLLERLEHDDA